MTVRTRDLGDFGGKCPACGHPFGVAPEPAGVVFPSFRLEVCDNDGSRTEWRLSLFGVDSWWVSDGFSPARVRHTYWLCGDGHLFLEHTRFNGGHEAPEWRVQRFEVAAAMGSVAAGKSYLLLRTLSQRLVPGGLGPPGGRAILPAHGNHVERRVLELLRREYESTEDTGATFNPTSLSYIMPNRFLADTVDRALVDRIMQIHAELNPGAAPEALRQWGRRVRQPIVRRYEIGGRKVLTAVADLPGEFFDPDASGFETQQTVLRTYTNLVWVVDPVLSDDFVDLLPADDRERLLLGSMRPDVDTRARLEQGRRRRRAVQAHLADQLAGVANDYGGDEIHQNLFVALTKADLLALVLRRGGRLVDLGRPGAVVEGTARYLLYAAERLQVDELAAKTLIQPLTSIGQSSVQQRRALHLAAALVAHYSDGERLWNLVHHGGPDMVPVPAGLHPVETPGMVEVPGIDAHIETATAPGVESTLHQRDLVMSALTCGLLHGIGVGQSVISLLRHRWRDVRFFLCSPLTAVPVPRHGTEEAIAPMDAKRFAQRDDPSAGLAQLHLSLLMGVR